MTAAVLAHDAPEGATAAFYVSRLAMTSFRSYDAAEVVSDGRPLAFWGPNGAGKTNILEALSLLAPGRGLRGAKLGEAMRRAGGAEPRPWAIAARVRQGGDEVALRTGIDAMERREVRIDGEKAAPGDLGCSASVRNTDGLPRLTSRRCANGKGCSPTERASLPGSRASKKPWRRRA